MFLGFSKDVQFQSLYEPVGCSSLLMLEVQEKYN